MNVNVTSYFQVVELSYAKRVLLELNMSFKRLDADYLEVYSDEKKTTPIGKLFIDEGFFTGTMHENGIRASDPCWELVDGERWLAMIVKKLSPEFKAEPGPYIGSGKNQRHMMSQWENELLRIGKTEYVQFL